MVILPDLTQSVFLENGQFKHLIFEVVFFVLVVVADFG